MSRDGSHFLVPIARAPIFKCQVLFEKSEAQTGQDQKKRRLKPAFTIAVDNEVIAEKVLFLRLLKNAPAFAEAASRRQADAS